MKNFLLTSNLNIPSHSLKPFPLALSLSDLAGALRKGQPQLTATSLQVVIESSKVSPEPPLLLIEQSQLLQPLLIRPLRQTPHQLCCPPLDMLQGLDAFLVVTGRKLDTSTRGVASPVLSTAGQLLLATLFLMQAKMPLAFLATWTHCWLNQ